MAIGISVLLGWALGIEALKCVVPGLISMKANAALGFVLAGAALGVMRDGRRNRPAIWLAAVVSAIGLMTLIEYSCGIDLGIDQILTREPAGMTGMLVPGRMHPTTAFDFVLLGVAMVLVARGRADRTAHALTLVAMLVAGSALIGYAYGVRLFVGIAIYNQMALHTAVGILVLSAGLLMVRPGCGLMAGITGNTAGGRVARRLLPVAIFLPFLLNGLILLSRRANWFDDRFAAAVRVTGTIAILGGVIGRLAHSLARVDRERKRSDEAFHLLAAAMPQPTWTARPDGRMDYCNRPGFSYGDDEDLLSDTTGWEAAVHPDDLDRSTSAWRRALLAGVGYEVENRLRMSSDDSYRWYLMRAEPMRDEDGRLLRWFGTCTDIHEQKIAGDRRFRSLVEATASIVWSTPASGEFESEQPGWSAFTGQSFEQLRGWGWIDAIHPDDRPETSRAWAEAVASRSLYQVEHRVRRHDGEYLYMSVRAIPILSPCKAICEWVGVHTDVDIQKRAAAALREGKEAAEAATRAKGEFLANMSHEIRTPMNGILGMTELALGTDLTPRQREYLGLAKSSAEALLTVIDDILDFSKIEAGKLAIDPIPFLLRDEVTNTLRALALKAHAKGLELAFRIAPDLPEWLVGDPFRLRQILMNLVGNALKFTERGEVCVAVETGEPGGSGREVRVSVADTGIGIPAEKRDAIFAPFEQADGSTTRKYGGTGLGLAITSRLVALMGGRIWVEDNPCGGSIFRFTIRLDDAMEPLTRNGPSPPPAATIAGHRVLIVDDNRTNRLILEELLSQWGCRVQSAPGGSEAMEILHSAAAEGKPFAAVLLDLMMPVMDGCMLAAKIRDDPALGRVGRLMLTSSGGDESARFPDLGISAWLAKPIRHSELFNALASLLDPAGTGGETVVPTAESSQITTGRRLRVLLADDHPINQKVASRLLEVLGHEVTIVGNGREAVEANESTDFDVILMDVQMPEMDGFEATAAIRSAEKTSRRHVPIVALTAHAMAGDRERCLAAGCDDYLSKPVSSAKLRDLLGRLDGLESRTDAEDAPPAREFDRSAAMESVGGDESLLIELLGLFFDDYPRLMGAIREAVQCGDLTSLARLAHTLAGASGHFAAQGVEGAARRLDALARKGELADAGIACEDLDGAVGRFRLAVDETFGVISNGSAT